MGIANKVSNTDFAYGATPGPCFSHAIDGNSILCFPSCI